MKSDHLAMVVVVRYFTAMLLLLCLSSARAETTGDEFHSSGPDTPSSDCCPDQACQNERILELQRQRYESGKACVAARAAPCDIQPELIIPPLCDDPPVSDPSGDTFASQRAKPNSKPTSAPPGGDSFESRCTSLLQPLAEIAQHVLTPPTHELIVVATDRKGRPLKGVPQAEAWRAPGTKTSENCEMACLQSAIAQDLIWQTGLPYVAKPRYPHLFDTVNPGVDVPPTKWDYADTLKHYYGAMPVNPAYTCTAEDKRLVSKGELLYIGTGESARQWIGSLLAERRRRDPKSHPRVLVHVSKEGNGVDHVFNGRWLPTPDGVEFHDATTGKPAIWRGVTNVWIYPTE